MKSDIENYHIVAFHKFTYMFHKTLTTAMRVNSMYTTNELVDYIETLNKKNYDLSKHIKEKEDQLLKEYDKKLFFQKKIELESMYYDKNYFVTLEKNCVKYNLIYELRQFVRRIDEMEYSGEQIKKEEVSSMFSKSSEYVSQLLETEGLESPKVLSKLRERFRYFSQKILPKTAAKA